MKPVEPGAPKGGFFSKIFFNEVDEDALSKAESAKKRRPPSILLKIKIGEKTRQTEVRSFPCVIGRSKEDANVVCDDASVGKRHAIIDYSDKKVTITDNHSRNGVEVDGLRLIPSLPRELFQGDHIVLGRVEIDVVKLPPVM